MSFEAPSRLLSSIYLFHKIYCYTSNSQNHVVIYMFLLCFNGPFLIGWYLFPRGKLFLPGLQESWIRNCLCCFTAAQSPVLPDSKSGVWVLSQAGSEPIVLWLAASPLLSPLGCEVVLDMRLDQSPPAFPDLHRSRWGQVLCTRWLQALGFEQLLHILPTDLYSQAFKLNFPFALLRAQRTAAHILSLL